MTVIALKQGTCRNIEKSDAVIADLTKRGAKRVMKPCQVLKRCFRACAQSRGRSVASVYRGK